MCVCVCVCVCRTHARAVMSDSLGIPGLWPTRLLCPWDFTSKNTGVGCHFLLQGIFPTQGLNLWLLHWSFLREALHTVSLITVLDIWSLWPFPVLSEGCMGSEPPSPPGPPGTGLSLLRSSRDPFEGLCTLQWTLGWTRGGITPAGRA